MLDSVPANMLWRSQRCHVEKEFVFLNDFYIWLVTRGHHTILKKPISNAIHRVFLYGLQDSIVGKLHNTFDGARKRFGSLAFERLKDEGNGANRSNVRWNNRLVTSWLHPLILSFQCNYLMQQNRLRSLRRVHRGNQFKNNQKPCGAVWA